MKFRKKPVVVEAEQFHGFYTQWPAGVEVDQESGPRCFVTTIHGQKAYLDTGDWVITEPDGIHHYPCKDEIFRASYDPVEDVAQSTHFLVKEID